MDNQKLLGLQRAEFKKAEDLQLLSRILQGVIVGVALLSSFVNIEWASYAGTVTCLLLLAGWQWASYASNSSKFIAERARRHTLLTEGLGFQVSGKIYSDLIMDFSVSEQEGKKHEDPNYFKDYDNRNYRKLACMLEESVFWTKHLYCLATGRYFKYLIVGIIISITALLFLIFVNNHELMKTISQTVCVFLTWLITAEIFKTTLAFSRGEKIVDDIENRLHLTIKNDTLENDLLVIFEDYNAVVQETAIIPTSIYKKNRDKLNKLWNVRQKDL